ncbi:hypothetical protein DTG28_23445 [Salmonella enterica subsp. salamae]|nr:hypothetical protein [Salmonella enterica subsp. salamae]ECW0140540.1 hypothetical protein [Salmonella enterica subsp. salamae]
MDRFYYYEYFPYEEYEAIPDEMILHCIPRYGGVIFFLGPDNYERYYIYIMLCNSTSTSHSNYHPTGYDQMSTIYSRLSYGSGTTLADCGVSAKAYVETAKTAKRFHLLNPPRPSGRGGYYIHAVG